MRLRASGNCGATARCLLLVELIAFALGCSSLDTTNYGPPGGLTGKKVPAPTNIGDASSSGSSGGGVLSEGGPCPVSWATDIFPKMTAAGSWKCADPSCHGGTQPPPIGADPNAAYMALSSYTLTQGPQKVPYVLPGNPDPTQSGIECNLAGTTCGPQMPLTSNGALLPTSQDIQTIDTWVRCGSPDN